MSMLVGRINQLEGNIKSLKVEFSLKVREIVREVIEIVDEQTNEIKTSVEGEVWREYKTYRCRGDIYLDNETKHLVGKGEIQNHNGSTFIGEMPHGYGTHTFVQNGECISVYKGQIRNGKKIGFGELRARDNVTWDYFYNNKPDIGRFFSTFCPQLPIVEKETKRKRINDDEKQNTRKKIKFNRKSHDIICEKIERQSNRMDINMKKDKMECTKFENFRYCDSLNTFCIYMEKGSSSFSGLARIEYENGSIYKGETLNGLRHGIGEYFDIPHYVYRGQFKYGTFHGIGKINRNQDKSDRLVYFEDNKLIQNEIIDNKSIHKRSVRLQDIDMKTNSQDKNKFKVGEAISTVWRDQKGIIEKENDGKEVIYRGIIKEIYNSRNERCQEFTITPEDRYPKFDILYFDNHESNIIKKIPLSFVRW